MSKNDNQTRRGAILGLGAAAGTLLASCKKRWRPAKDDDFSLAREKPYVPGAERFATHEERWANTTCDQCAAGCGIRVRVVEGRAVRIEGNPANPLNQGGIGARGLAGLQVLYDPDRITGPMLRRGGALEAASWDEALDAAAKALEKASGPDVVIMTGRERGMMRDLLRRMCRGLGGARFLDGRHNRSGPIAEAMRETLGAGEMPIYDWSGARTVLSLEAGLMADSCQAVYFARLAAERRGRPRPRLIHVSSNFDLAAHSADRWLRIKPGTSGALALGLVHALFKAGTFDRAQLEQARGRAEFDALIEAFPPARTAELTGLEPQAIAELARTLWRGQPSFAVVDERSAQFSNGVDTARASLALNAALGAIEATSGGLQAPIEPPLRPWPESDGRIDEVEGPEALLASLEDDRLPELALLHQVNPIFSRAHPRRWRDALSKIDSVISFSPFLDETTSEVANIVLPDHTFLERHEDAASAPALPRTLVAIRQPVVAPLHDTRASGDVILELARRVGGSLATALPWSQFSEAVEARLLGLHDTGRGNVQAPSEHAFLRRLYETGFWVDAGPPPTRPVTLGLPGRWNEPEWLGDSTEFPLKLLIYRPLGTTTGGGGANLPWLQQLKGLPGDRAWRRYARVHPASAPGIEDGDDIEIATAAGRIRMPVLLDHQLAEGVVTVPLGGGHTAFGRFARGLGVNPMELAASDRLCETRARIRRAT